jgi:CheY-like chemotaxis protein
MLGRLIGEDVELVLSLHPGAGFLFADPVEIEQVLMNLAVNAKDAMPEGGRLLIETMPFEVDAHTTPPLALPPGGYTMLAVTDTGAGMAPDVKAHLFEPFFTTKEPGKGTGLGLSTVYGIVTRCGGAILIDSEPGRGTAFKLIFPAVAGERTELAAVPGEAAARGDETVLLAEDESGVRKYVRDILHHHGYTVLEAANGRDALARAREYPGPIHLLLADAVMPEMGGLELSRQFGKARPGVPVLCMSGYSNDAWPGAGVQGNYIQKPFGAVALLTQIRTLLKAKSGAT